MKLPGLVQFKKCSLTDNELAEAVAEGLCKMYSEPVSVPSRHIPARPDEDFDLLVGELVVRFMEKYKNERLLPALKRLSFMAQTTGGTEGKDPELVAAIDEAVAVIAEYEQNNA